MRLQWAKKTSKCKEVLENLATFFIVGLSLKILGIFSNKLSETW